MVPFLALTVIMSHAAAMAQAQQRILRHATSICMHRTLHFSLQLPRLLLLQVFLATDFLVIVMEYVPGGNLVSYLRRHPKLQLCEAQARWIFQQLVIGLDYCHSKVSHTMH